MYIHQQSITTLPKYIISITVTLTMFVTTNAQDMIVLVVKMMDVTKHEIDQPYKIDPKNHVYHSKYTCWIRYCAVHIAIIILSIYINWFCVVWLFKILILYMFILFSFLYSCRICSQIVYVFLFNYLNVQQYNT